MKQKPSSFNSAQLYMEAQDSCRVYSALLSLYPR